MNSPYEDEPPTASAMATDVLESLREKGLLEKKTLHEDEAQELQDRARDIRTWQDPVPETEREAAFYANLGLRLTRGIKQEDIRKMSVSDRITASRRCFDIRQQLQDRPPSKINYDARSGIMDALPALQAELARRQRERTTINVTPGEGE